MSGLQSKPFKENFLSALKALGISENHTKRKLRLVGAQRIECASAASVSDGKMEQELQFSP